jgi:peptide/nickel transport system substrate-binding protein
MKRIAPRAAAGVVLAVAVALLAAAAALASASSHQAAAGTLVVDRSFEIKTSDPQRAFEPTASIIDRALYDTLLTYKGSDVAHPVPLLATGYTASKDAKTFTFTLRKDARFADGTNLTSADVVFSYNRLINLKGNPSFLLAGVKASARGPYTVVLKSNVPNAALPSIVTNTSLGVVNSKLAKQHGATDKPGADKSDKAEQWFNSSASTGAGSGPYVLKQYSTTSQIILQANSKSWRGKPGFSTVVVRNQIAPTQLINVQRGSHEIAIDLSADQAKGLIPQKNLKVDLSPSTIFFWLFTNNNTQISQVTPNKHFQNAVRFGVDYQSIVQLGGGGTRQAAGVIPSNFLGALPLSDAVKRDVAKAKSELAASNAGGQTITLEFPSDVTLNGVPFPSMAQKVQSNLQEIGLKVDLQGEPVATWLPKYRDGKMAFGLSLWGPDYPDPSDYLAFLPGQLVGLRAGWPAGSDPALEKLGQTARVTTDNGKREALYQQIQRQLNVDGPYMPLIQPTQVFVSTRDLKGAAFNAVYFVDVTQVKPA